MTPQDRGLLNRIVRAAGRDIPQAELPSVEDVEAIRATRLQSEVAASIDGITDADRGLVLDLVADGRDPMEIAAAAFALARSERNEAPLNHIQTPGARRGPSPRAPQRDRGARHNDASYTQLVLDAGRDAGVLPGQVVSAIARTADIPGSALGKIQIRDHVTLVDVQADVVERVLAQSGDLRFGKRMAQIDRA